MAKIKAIYDDEDDIPSAHRELYTKRGDKFELTEIEGVANSGDVQRLQTSLTKERDEHKATKAKLRAFGDADPETLHDDLDDLKELRVLRDAGKFAGDEEKIAKLADARVQREVAPLKRDLARAVAERDEATGTLKTSAEKLRTLQIRNAINSAGAESKMLTPALEDALLFAERVFDVAEDGAVVVKDDAGFAAGMTPQEWLAEMKDRRPHWWPGSEGGGSRPPGNNGDTGSNPWSAKGWNITEQMKVHTVDAAKAARLAQQAGSAIGAVRPPKSA